MLTRNSSLESDNCKALSLSRCILKSLPGPVGQGRRTRCMHHCNARAAQNIEGHHRPVFASNFHSLDMRRVPLRSCHERNEPQKGFQFVLLVNRLRSRSLTELTRQNNPPTKNGHAPPFAQSRKSSQSVNPTRIRTW